MRLVEPFPLGPRTARNRVIFGPHETNLGRGRAISERHVAYYRRRATGGAGVIVIEEASVHDSDWPYERCPLATESSAGWAAVADACRGQGSIVLAALGHSGGQGSSAYSQAPLWAPSRVPEVNSREVPKWMEAADIEAVVAGFGAAARLAMDAGLDGVEVNAGQHSLLRQFLSGLTNHRSDQWGTERLLFARRVLATVRAAAGPEAIVGLRLSCDELAPWAGIVPNAAVDIAGALVVGVDYVTVVRGSIFTISATRPDGHVAPGFNLDLAQQLRAGLPANVAVVAQGSIVDVDQAEAALAEGRCDAVEMTRAQIADADLGRKAAAGHLARIRPCILCNQACQVRDARNPLVSCAVEPGAGHEWEDPPVEGRADEVRNVLVVGAGVAGLECARVAASRGHTVTVAERSGAVGGMVAVAAQGAGRDRLALASSWLVDECRQLGVRIETGRVVDAAALAGESDDVVLCTGSLPGRRTYEVAGGVVVLAADVLAGASGGLAAGAGEVSAGAGDLLAGGSVLAGGGPVAVWDPIGGPIGISVAERLRAQGIEVSLITPDLIAGNELSRSGDLAPANVRLLASGVTLEKRAILRRVMPGEVEVEDRFTGVRRMVPAATLVDAGYRLPDDTLWRESGMRFARAGDAVAPRTMYEAILEGRRQAMALELGLVPSGARR